MTRGTINLAKNLCQNKNVLTLGLGNGTLAKEIDEICSEQIVVEGSNQIITTFKKKLRRSQIFCKYFEDIDECEKYDVILANHVLEHVEDPVSVMKNNLLPALLNDGQLFITVPNANSLHRRIGVNMGLLSQRSDLNNSDIRAGHRRVYDKDMLLNDIKSAGFQILMFGGYNLKLVSNNQMLNWDDSLLKAIFEESLKVDPDMCANLFVTASKKE